MLRRTQITPAAPRHTPANHGSCVQNTGAPISRSRTDPPPTPVISAKNVAVTNVCPARVAASAPEAANTPIPNRSR